MRRWVSQSTEDSLPGNTAGKRRVNMDNDVVVEGENKR
jgi:hypothetical protein